MVRVMWQAQGAGGVSGESLMVWHCVRSTRHGRVPMRLSHWLEALNAAHSESDRSGSHVGVSHLDVTLPLVASFITAVGLIGAAPGPRDVSAGWLGWMLVPALGVFMVLRRVLPVGTLVASMVVVLAYYISGRPPIGFELLLAPATFSAAERGHLRGPSAQWRPAAR